MDAVKAIVAGLIAGIREVDVAGCGRRVAHAVMIAQGWAYFCASMNGIM